jgi:hypothetical protein
MTNTIKTIALPLITLISFQSNAQESATKSKKWGFEVDFVQPFIPEVEIITAKITSKALMEKSKPNQSYCSRRCKS